MVRSARQCSKRRGGQPGPSGGSSDSGTFSKTEGKHFFIHQSLEFSLLFLHAHQRGGKDRHFTSAALKLVVVGPGFFLTKAYRSTEAGPCQNLPAWFLAANTGMGNTPLGPSRMTSVSHMGPWTDSKQSFSQNYANCTSSNRCVTKPR